MARVFRGTLEEQLKFLTSNSSDLQLCIVREHPREYQLTLRTNSLQSSLVFYQDTLEDVVQLAANEVLKYLHGDAEWGSVSGKR